MRIAIVTGSILLALAGRAAAQPVVAPPGMSSSPQQRAPAPAGQEPLNDGVAVMLSLGGTAGSWLVLLAATSFGNDTAKLAGITLGAAGAMLAPGLGHWYAGTYVTRGTVVRLTGAAILGSAIFVAVKYSAIFKGDPADFDRGFADSYAYLGALAGAVLFVTGTVDDIITAPRGARRYNRERGFSIAPVVSRGSAGLALGGSF